MKPFPKKMKGQRDLIVLFSKPKTGVVVYAGESIHDAGSKSKKWVMNFFEDMEEGFIKPRKLNTDKL